MMTLSNNTGQMEKGQKSARKRICSQLLVFVGLGTMVLAVCSLLLGCGSDSTPGGSEKGKNAKTSSIPAAKQSQAPAMLLMGGKGASGAGEMADIKKQPEPKSVVMPDITLEEMEARNAAAVKMARSPGFEIAPGVTREEMEARNAAAAKMARSPGIEIMPGVTLEEMKKRNAAALANAPKKPNIQVKREISPPAGGK
ncbi:MAG: hypothetical protein KKD99_06340 [Proteobacteria bacterium]|nr:hypothetical protein [Pseudomonadota bacterium]